MLLNFVATLQDGVTLGRSVTENRSKSISWDAAGEAEGGAANILSILGLKINASGELSRSSEKDNSVEQTFTRQHTMASLFSLLMTALREADAMKEDPDISDLSPGDVVVFEAQIAANPLDVVMTTMQGIMPLIELTVVPEKPRGNRDQRRGKAPMPALAQDDEDGMTPKDFSDLQSLVGAVDLDQKSSPVLDLVAEADAFTAIVTADREYFSPASREAIIGGQFKVVGKVTSVVPESGHEIPLIRRGASSRVTDMVKGLTDMIEAMNSDVLANPLPPVYVQSPSIQVLPLAIFV